LTPATCCTWVTIAPGDRFAVQLDGDTMRSWHVVDGEWRALRSIAVPGVDLADAATLRDYGLMFELRGDPGTISLDRFEARSHGD
jgi:hypothetical protein